MIPDPGRMRSDRGFTLTELLVFMALLGVILAVAYTLSQAVMAGQRTADRHTGVAKAINYPMTRMSEVIMQNVRIESAGDMTLTLQTDQDLNDIPERHTFSIRSVGGDTVIEHRSFNLSSAGVPVGAARFVHQLGTGVTNVPDGSALFRYFNAAGDPITDMARVSAEARSLSITIRANVDGRRVQESTRVLFRNR